MQLTRRHLLMAGTTAAGASALGWRLRGVDPAPTTTAAEVGERPLPAAPVVPPLARVSPWPAGLSAGVNLAHLHARGRGYGSAACRARLEDLAQHGVKYVVLTPFAYQADLTTTQLRFGDLDRTLTDADLLACAADIRALGMRPVLKPHIWCPAFWRSGASRQDIRPDPAHGGWPAWFEAYAAFAVSQARLAAHMDAALLVVGLEYLQATLDVPGAWAEVAHACRAEFGGPLTYAANWWREAEHFADWDAFDLIGVNAYYPLDAPPEATAADLARAWHPHLARLGSLAEQTGKSVLFCEAGMPAVTGAWTEPWNHGFAGPTNPAAPATYMEGLLRALVPQPWFAGVYWWKWFTDDPTRGPGREQDPYRLAGQPGAEVLRRWWAG